MQVLPKSRVKMFLVIVVSSAYSLLDAAGVLPTKRSLTRKCPGRRRDREYVERGNRAQLGGGAGLLHDTERDESQRLDALQKTS